jgi:transposase
MTNIHRRARLIRERRRDPVPRFKPDICHLSDPVRGCLELQIPVDHLARVVKAQVAGLDVSSLERKYSSQGRQGFHPRQYLAVLIYAGRMGVHHSTKIASFLETDAAFRFVAGGYAISEGRLRAFRRENAEFFAAALQQTLAFAQEDGLLDPQELAVDSVRLRAEASTKAVRTLKRSRERLKELAKVDVSTLDDVEAGEHEAKVLKHQEVIRLCTELKVPNLVTTSPSAGLMAFPSGTKAPGHRVTTVGCGVQLRLVIDVLIDAASNDYGKLAASVMRARKALLAAGVTLDKPMQLAADAGYFSTADLIFAAGNGSLVDALIAEGKTPQRKSKEGLPIFTSDDFSRVEGKLVCPAGLPMKGPVKDGTASNTERWRGTGCDTCGLKAQCTSAAVRSVTIDLDFQAGRDAMRERMRLPGADERYNQRIATVEPIFSSIQDAMGFRRVSGLKSESVRAEILLKVLTYNLSRLTAAKRPTATKRLTPVKMIAGEASAEEESHAA